MLLSELNVEEGQVVKKGSVEGAYKSAISQLEAKIDQGVWSSRKAG